MERGESTAAFELQPFIPSERRIVAPTLWTFHLTIFVLNLVLAITLYSQQPQYYSRTVSTYPGGGELLYRNSSFELVENSKYAGPPSPGIDEAWRILLQHVNLRVTPSELSDSRQTSAIIPGTSESLAWLEVSHQLHCVKFIRQWVYKEVYYPDKTGPVDEHWSAHVDHCIDLVRQAIMCKADTSLATFMWVRGQSRPMLKRDQHVHECVDWESLMSGISSRIISVEEMQKVSNPYLDTLADSV